jgi:nitrate reductase beta subunit
MVWYVPPLSPVLSTIEGRGAQAGPDDVFPAIDALRIPIRYLANLLAAGDETVVRRALKRLAAMRSYMRETLFAGRDTAVPADAAGLQAGDLEEIYRLLAIAKFEDRFVIPPAHAEVAGGLMEQQGACGLEYPGGPGRCAQGTDGWSVPGREPDASSQPPPATGERAASRRTLPVLQRRTPR